jgi:ribose transport system permease protein
MSEQNQGAAKTGARTAVAGLRRVLGSSSEIVSIFIALVALSLFFTLTSPYFLTVKNVLNFTMNTSILGIMAAGLFVTMVIGAIDVSQYSILALSTAILAIFVRGGMHPVLGVLIALAVSLACGVLNGFSVAFLRINPIITTLGTGMILRGIAYKITEARAMGVTGDFFHTIGSGRLLGIPVSVYIMAGIFLVVHVLLTYTAHGKRVYAVGGNAEASYISGVNVRMVRFWGMVVSAAAAGFAGIIFVAQLGATVPSAGETGLMDVVTAVILGGISLSGGKGKIVGTVIGVLILAVLQNGMVLLSVQSYYQIMVKGAVVLVAVYVDSLRGGGFR